MKTSHKFLVIAGLISITFIVPTLQAQIRPPDRVRSRTEISSKKLTTAQLESSILAVMEEHHIPGVAALIVKDDSVIWSGNYGYADIARDKLVSDSTLWSVYSISKLVTATALMQLWDQGLFHLDDSVNSYLPQTLQFVNPNHPSIPITFRMLLSHTSSITNEYIAEVRVTERDSPISIDQYLSDYIYGIYPNIKPYTQDAPGTLYTYTNNAYALIGYLVETIADTPFVEYCRKYIFNPLEMSRTSWLFADIDLNDLAQEYIYSAGNYKSGGRKGSPLYPAIQLKTTSRELANFMIAWLRKGDFRDRRILQPATVDTMLKTHIKTETETGDIVGCGLGWHSYEYDWQPPFEELGSGIYYNHLGRSLWGTNTLIDMGYGENAGVIFFLNLDTGHYTPHPPDFVNTIWITLWDYVAEIITAVEVVVDKIPLHYTLSQNYPNPFNPSTTIEFTLPKSEFVELKVFNILGKEVSTLVSKKLNQGNHIYTFYGKNLASGIYYYQLTAGEFHQVKKMILLK